MSSRRDQIAAAAAPVVDYYVVLDFEATCVEGATIFPQEIIEFPSVVVDAHTATIVCEFQRYVRPLAHPQLSDFCTSLTGIAQRTVDKAKPFSDVYIEWLQWMEDVFVEKRAVVVIVTCGDWDLKTMFPLQYQYTTTPTAGKSKEKDMRQAELPYPAVLKRWCNIKHAFQHHLGVRVRAMPQMLDHFKLPLIGRHHSGIDDCRNIARVLCAMIARGKSCGVTADHSESDPLPEKAYFAAPCDADSQKGLDPISITDDEPTSSPLYSRRGSGAPQAPEVKPPGGEDVIQLRLHNRHEWPAFAVHVTSTKAWPDISLHGLKRFDRDFIPFSATVSNISSKITAKCNGVLSSVICVYLDLERLIKENPYPVFYSPSQGCVLCAGNEEGIILQRYCLKAETGEVTAMDAMREVGLCDDGNRPGPCSLSRTPQQPPARGLEGSFAGNDAEKNGARQVSPTLVTDGPQLVSSLNAPVDDLLQGYVKPSWLTLNEEVACSKALSHLLRHGAFQVGVPIRSDGFVAVDDLLKSKNKKLAKLRPADLAYMVKSNNKQRFAMEYGEDRRTYIRANQGHSMAGIVVEMIPIRSVEEIPVREDGDRVVVHGTTHDAWNAIRYTGLSKMNRQHIHFATALPRDSTVVSGMRQSSQVLIYIDIRRALHDGVPFLLSANNVVLTPGVGETGHLPPEYFSKVVDVKTGKDLLKDEETA